MAGPIILEHSACATLSSRRKGVPIKVFLVALFVAVPIATFVGVADAQLPPGSVKTVGTAHSHYATLIPLSQMATCQTPSPTPNPGMIGPARPGPKSDPGQVLLSGPIVSFEGLQHGELHDGNFCSCPTCPSDDSGAVGFDYYVQTVNYAIIVYDKSGNVLAGPVSGTTFWENQPDLGGSYYWSDAVVRFDRYANRWVISRPGGTPYGQYLGIAVSQTSDPTGKYDQYAFEVNNTANQLSGFFNDYPKISVFSDAYYATADPNKIFSGLGNTISAFERAAMLAGNPTPQFVTFFVPAPRNPSQITHSHMLAADLEGRRLPLSGTPEYVVQVQDSHLGFPADRLQVYEFHVDWHSPSSSTFVPTQSLVPQPFNSNACPIAGDFQACIEQPGVAQRLDSLSYGYMMQRLTYRNFGPRQTLLLNHTVAADGDPSHRHAGIRWYELRMRTRGRTRSPWEIYQQGTYAPDADNRWLGSIAMDGMGNIALGFNVSGASVFPSVHYVGRRPTDPLGTLPSGEMSLIDGGGALRDNKYFGDYSQMTIDPVDDCTFWYTGTYLPTTTTQNDWSTRIGSFRFTSCHGRDEDSDK
jgi:hypothetical protein